MKKRPASKEAKGMVAHYCMLYMRDYDLRENATAKTPTTSGRDSDHATAIAILYVDEWESIQRQHEPVHIVPKPHHGRTEIGRDEHEISFSIR